MMKIALALLFASILRTSTTGPVEVDRRMFQFSSISAGDQLLLYTVGLGWVGLESSSCL